MSYTWPKHFGAEVVEGSFGGGLLSSYTIALEAWRRGLRVVFTSSNLYHYTVSDGEKTLRFDRSRPLDLTTREAFRIVENKHETTAKLRAAGVSAPHTVDFESASVDFAEVAKLAESFGYPVVLKPVRGSKGNGVLAGIPDEAELRASFDWLINEYGAKDFVLEKHYPGEEYRIYVVGGKCVAAGIKVPAHVIGDGSRSISELIADKNEIRKGNPFMAKALIRPDFEVDQLLAGQSYTYDSVPEEGVRVRLRAKASGSAGGDFVDRTKDLPQHIRDAAVGAVAAIPGLAAAGLDVLVDPTKPKGEDYVVIELNARAHIGLNMYPTEGVGQEVPAAILDAYFPNSQRLPIRRLHNLGFHARDTTEPLRNQVSDSVAVRPIPRHGFWYRRKFTVDLPSPLGDTRLMRLVRLAERLKVSGTLDLSEHTLVLGGRRRDVVEFVAGFGRATGGRLSEEARWDEVFRIGFRVIGS